jgi:lipoprotein-anchoring transpeptidase ErfK/SrfK
LLLEEEAGPKLAPLGEELAVRLGIDTTPVERGDLPVDAERLFLTVANPSPLGNASGPGRKRIEVDVTAQQVRLFQGGQKVLESPISTGLWPNKTELGSFRVRYKKRKEDMRGATDDEGNVVWIVGEGGGPPAGSIPYGVEDVPDVLYINQQAEALHGAYWHNSFGQTMSHGCINQPLDVAAFVYDWAPLGTPVRVFVQEGHVYPGSENATPEELAKAAEDTEAAGGLSSPFAVGGA